MAGRRTARGGGRTWPPTAAEARRAAQCTTPSPVYAATFAARCAGGALTAAHRVHDKDQLADTLSSRGCSTGNECASLPHGAVQQVCCDAWLLCRGAQKKLCGEPDCPRCEARDQEKHCIGVRASPMTPGWHRAATHHLSDQCSVSMPPELRSHAKQLDACAYPTPLLLLAGRQANRSAASAAAGRAASAARAWRCATARTLPTCAPPWPRAPGCARTATRRSIRTR